MNCVCEPGKPCMLHAFRGDDASAALKMARMARVCAGKAKDGCPLLTPNHPPEFTSGHEFEMMFEDRERSSERHLDAASLLLDGFSVEEVTEAGG